ncbi:MAG: preprotein translocase subunit SecG [Phycisphaeraceae bacterium]|nr:MAG: preprotein translocase subunit SecG [Phycisphaeraceae bacterium]
MILTLAQIPAWLVSLLAIFFLVVCLSMILIVLIQRPQGGGLSGAFGAGGGSGQTAFGTKTGDVLTLVTIGIFVLFLGTAVGLNFAVRPPAAKAPSNQVSAPATSQETPPATPPGGDGAQQPDTGGAPSQSPAGIPADQPGTQPPAGEQTPADTPPPAEPAPTAPSTGDGAP